MADLKVPWRGGSTESSDTSATPPMTCRGAVGAVAGAETEEGVVILTPRSNIGMGVVPV